MLDEGMHAGAGEGLARAFGTLAGRASGWEARLTLRFEGGQRSLLRTAEHFGPLRVQRPFYPHGDPACHVYILHPPGGVVGGDSLAVDVHAGEGARALLTAPGATKLYRSTGARARIDTRLSAADGAFVEWFPHEAIAFDGALASLSTHVSLSAQASYAGWEIVCLGRPTSGERFRSGSVRTTLRIERAGRVCFQERGAYDAGDPLLEAPYGLSGYPVFGTFVVASPRLDPAWLEALREQIVIDDGVTSVTLVSGVLIVRGFARSTRVLRAVFERAFVHLRPLYAGAPAVLPRIWNT